MRRFLVLFLVLGVTLMCTSRAFSAQPKEGLLLVAFGTSQEDALRSYAAIEADFRKAFGDRPLVWAYTSKIIRNKMAKQGKTMLSINQALDKLAQEGVNAVTVQSLHVAGGEEYTYLERAVLAYALNNPGRFVSVKIGRPLLESAADLDAVVHAVADGFPKERTADEAVVFMGHGQEHGRGDLVLQSLAAGLSAHDPLYIFATVEGAIGFDEALKSLREKGVKRVWLQPFMIVAGEHAKNDLMGDDDDSWASRARATGLEVKGNLHGLGEFAGIRALFVKHAQDTNDNILQLKAD